VNATAQSTVAADWGSPAATDAAVILAGTDTSGFPFNAAFG
jgi:hypothetical protein